MDTLSVENVNTISSYLKEPEDIKNIRLVCKSFAKIGLHHLARQHNLVFLPGSFDKLMQIADHPVLGRNVNNLLFEGDRLMLLLTYKDWKAYITSPTALSIVLKNVRLPAPTPRTFRQRAQDGETQDSYQKCEGEQMGRGYAFFKERLEEQMSMFMTNHCRRSLQYAFGKLPNLKTVVLSMEQRLIDQSNLLRRSFRKGLILPYGDTTYQEPMGTLQFRDVLLAVAASALDMITGHVRFLNYSDWYLMHPAMHSLTVFRIYIGGRTNSYYITRRTLFAPKVGCLRRFLQAALNLTTLEVILHDDVPDEFRVFSNNMGDFVWTNLRSIWLGFFCAQEDHIMKFFNDHSETLKAVHLENLQLVNGEWAHFLQSLRKTLHLESIALMGSLTAPYQQFIMYFSKTMRGQVRF